MVKSLIKDFPTLFFSPSPNTQFVLFFRQLSEIPLHAVHFLPVRIIPDIIISFVRLYPLIPWENWMHKKSKYRELYLEYNGGKNTFSEFIQYAKENSFEISNIQVSSDEYYHKVKGKQKTVSYIITVRSNIKRNHAEMIDILTQAKGIQYIEEL